MDHISAEIMAFAAEELRARDVLDVSWAPIFMKKGRPGYRLTVMCRIPQRDGIIDCIIANTRTLGVRHCVMQRVRARRQSASASMGDRHVEVKVCKHKDSSFTKPEYESAARAARELGIPLIDFIERFCQRGNEQT